MKKFVFILLLGLMPYVQADQGRWTWLYRKLFSAQEQQNCSQRKQVLFTKNGVKPFTQLVFSWNALRPKSGYFSFWVQTRDAGTKKWGRLHRMMDWGAQIQKSYFDKSDGYTKYVHVRLETEQGKQADAFRIKIMGQNGADLGLLRGLGVALSNFKSFKPEHIDSRLAALPSLHIKNVPQVSQMVLDHPEKKSICSPTSCSIVTSYLSGNKVDPGTFADGAFDHGLQIYGSWPFNMAHAFEQGDGAIWFFTARLNSFKDLYRQIQRGIPAVVSVRGWLTGAPKEYDKGHLLVVVGWDAYKKEVICHDSALPEHNQTVKRYPIQSFVRAWERSHRLTYIAEPVKEI